MQQVQTSNKRNLIHLILDSAIFVAVLVAMAPHWSGIAVHEWLSIAFGAAIVTHLLLHWRWLVAVTRSLFGRVQWSARINYVLNLLLFIDITIVIFTGLMISESALPLFGIDLHGGFAWRGLHDLTANISMLLVGLHIALHWQWIVKTVRRLLFAPLLARRRLTTQTKAEV